MKRISLTQGYTTIVDDSDYEFLKHLNLFAAKEGVSRDRVYARLYFQGLKIPLARFLMNARKGYVVDHINGDTLDNRRSNLRICTNSENVRNRRSSTLQDYGDLDFHTFGVRLNKSGRFSSRLGRRHLGHFDDVKAAAMARDAAIIESNDEFTPRNFTTPPDYEFIESHRCKSAKRWSRPRGRGYKGVFKHKKTGRYNARIVGDDGRSISLGYEDTREGAARLYDGAARLAWGQDCYLNFPDETQNIGVPSRLEVLPRINRLRQYTVHESSAILNVTQTEVYRLIRIGKLDSKKDKRIHHISGQSIFKYAKHLVDSHNSRISEIRSIGQFTDTKSIAS